MAHFIVDNESAPLFSNFRSLILAFLQNFGHMIKYTDEVIQSHCKALIGGSLMDAIAIVNQQFEPATSATEFQRLAWNAQSMKRKNLVFLGDLCAANDEKVIRANGITHVVNLCDKCPESFYGLKYLSVLVPSEEDGDTTTSAQILYDNVHRILQFIDDAVKKEDGNVLIHSTRGVSRGFFIAAAYLMKEHHWNLDQATAHLMAVRPSVEPSDMVIAKLIEFAATSL